MGRHSAPDQRQPRLRSRRSSSARNSRSEFSTNLAISAGFTKGVLSSDLPLGQLFVHMKELGMWRQKHITRQAPQQGKSALVIRNNLRIVNVRNKPVARDGRTAVENNLHDGAL